MTKVDVISGFLGAGKTTLIKKLLKEALSGEQVALIENEFGEIAVDAGFLQEAGVQIREMNSGCICCSLVGDFVTALKEVIDTYHPDRIIIEPTGVGKLSDVTKAVTDAVQNEDVELGNAITVVDAKKCKMYLKNFGEFFKNQVEHAGTILLSRTDDISEEKLEQCIELIKGLNDHALIITTPWDQLTGEQILAEIEKKADFAADVLREMEEHECSCGHHHDHDHECTCGHDHHDHDHECTCGHDHHDHDHECTCGHDHHDHDHECTCGHDHHDHDHECTCGHDHHDHDHECTCGHDHGHGHHHHHADEVFTSWGYETPLAFSEEQLRTILAALNNNCYGMVLRSKGMVASTEPGKWLYFDMVPGECEIREGAPQVTGRVCVIGSGLQEMMLEILFGRK